MARAKDRRIAKASGKQVAVGPDPQGQDSIARARQVSETVELARLRHRTHVTLIDRGFLALRTAMKGGVAIALGVMHHEIIGKIVDGQGNWEGIVRAVVSGQASNFVMAGVTVLSVAYGLNEARLRHKVTKAQRDHIEALEKKVDPNRSGSNLTSGGLTRPEDKE